MVHVCSSMVIPTDYHLSRSSVASFALFAIASRISSERSVNWKRLLSAAIAADINIMRMRTAASAIKSFHPYWYLVWLASARRHPPAYEAV